MGCACAHIPEVKKEDEMIRPMITNETDIKILHNNLIIAKKQFHNNSLISI